MSFPASNSIPTTTNSPETAAADENIGSGLLMDDPNKKIRKPYTITKSRENWTDLEHDKFLEALHLFDRDWKKIEAFVGSKTAIQSIRCTKDKVSYKLMNLVYNLFNQQIRSHAQKYFLKVQKNGANEHVPPPRPKRKAAHPYPHKAPKNAVSKVREPFQSYADFLEPGDIIIQDSLSEPRNPTRNAALSSWTCRAIQSVSVPYCKQGDMRLSGASMSCNCCSSSIESNRGIWPTGETNNHSKMGRVIPDFAQVFRFIGSVFDPNASDHLQKLKMMDPVNVETVVLLMKNLCANLTSPKFEEHRRFISSHDVDTENIIPSSPFSNLHAVTPGNAIPSL